MATISFALLVITSSIVQVENQSSAINLKANCFCGFSITDRETEEQFGDVVYSVNDGRFVYRLGTEGRRRKLNIGFDGQEYWVAIFSKESDGKRIETECATIVIRFKQQAELTDNFLKLVPYPIDGIIGGSVHPYKGENLFCEIAFIEDFLVLMRIERKGRLTADDLIAAAKNLDGAEIIEKSKKWDTRDIDPVPGFFAPGNALLFVNGPTDKYPHMWKYVVELDRQQEFPIHRGVVGFNKSYKGGDPPWSRMAEYFQFQQIEMEFETAEFFPQFYCNTDTRIWTVANGVWLNDTQAVPVKDNENKSTTEK